MIYFFAGLGGAAGSLLRYLFSFLDTSGSFLPYGTLAVNLSGSFFLGWFSARYVVSSKKLHPYLSTVFATGLIGSYTTFSTFCLETVTMIKRGEILYALLYFFISILGGLWLVKLGAGAGKRDLGKAGEKL